MSSDNNSQNQVSSQKKQQTPLKTAICARISSSKRFLSTQVYQSPLFQIQSTDNRRETQNNSQLMSLVYEYQSKVHDGFYEYTNWINYCQKSFSHVPRDIIQELYKILRIVNYGEVLLPTGLVFELSQLFSKRHPVNQNIEQTLNNFLKFNDKPDKICNFRQLKNFRSLKQIQSIFRQPFSKKQRVSSFKPLKQKSENVFQRNFKQSNIRNYASARNICKNIASQVNACTFKPVICKYSSQRKNENSNLNAKRQRICDHKQKWKTREQQPLEQYLFKAKGFDSAKFQANMLVIPGVQQHISRRKYVYAEKQRLQRHFIKPVLLKKSKSPVKKCIDLQ